MRKLRLIVLGVFMSLAIVTSAQAIPIFYFDIDVQAQATQLLNGSWLYEYTLSKVDHPNETFKDMSHWWVELPEEKIETLSDFDPSDVETYFNAENHGPDGVYTQLGDLFNDYHYGVKWESDQLITYSFISTHGPVLNPDNSINSSAYSWFAKSGGDGFFDYGVTLGPNGSDDPGNVIPEPATLSLLGLGVLGVLGLRKRKA
ncbi:MAG: PEP-CTERM sorting domain-containing protein [Candidatus Omnitrophica bacterium]|nr:PEP-CTERM sorting domain-containing protein [Candidatus Omnitrophota bacterium]